MDFCDKSLDVLMKNLKNFLYDKYIKLFCNVPEEKYLAPLTINPFVDIASTFFDSSFN